MKLKDKLSLGILPFIVIVAAIQGLLFYFLKTPLSDSASPLLFSLIVAFSTIVLTSLVFLVLRHRIGTLVDSFLGSINEFAITILDNKDDTNQLLKGIDVEESKALNETLECLRKSVNIHQKSMEKMAFYDALTGLPNKEYLKQELKRMLSSAGRENKHLAVLYLDLDEFKTINDTLGHDVGDLLLSAASKRMQKLLRGSDYVDTTGLAQSQGGDSLLARLAGDEFTLLLSGIDEPNAISVVAKRILDGLAMSFNLNQHEVQLGASIGIAVYPQDGKDVEELLKKADFAMFEAKKQGRNNYQYYTKEMNDTAFKRITMETGIRRALEEQEFELNFHPRVNLKTENVIGFEALLRWQSPKMGCISPDQFLHIAEETILICEIGNWVFDNVCQYIKQWKEQGFEDIRVSINLSQMQIYRGDTYNLLKTYMALYGISGKNLEIEVTETGVLKDEKTAIELITKLRELGITVALDDFGTGYSSISFLQKLPIDVLKIDRSMIALDEGEKSSERLVKSVIDIAHNFDLTTVASGVEHQHQIDFVKACQCDYVQGYFYSKPMPGDEVVEFLTEWKAEA